MWKMLGCVLNGTRATNPGTGSIPCSPMSARNCRAAPMKAIR